MNYSVLVADEAIDDIFEAVRYISTELCNPDAAQKLYYDLNREVKSMGNFPLKFSASGFLYRGYIIHKKAYSSYLIFYIVDNEKQEIYVLRVIKDLMNWQNILDKKRTYHFSNYSKQDWNEPPSQK